MFFRRHIATAVLLLASLTACDDETIVDETEMPAESTTDGTDTGPGDTTDETETGDEPAPELTAACCVCRGDADDELLCTATPLGIENPTEQDCADWAEALNEPSFDYFQDCWTTDDGKAVCEAAACEQDEPAPAPSCDDRIINQDETDYDCGGKICEPCPNDMMCDVDGDCLSGFCYEGICED